MELEQRIKTLEYEMKILKNEVQRTLLDVQDQVLSQYPPAPQTDQPKTSGTIQAVETLQARQPAQPMVAPAAPAAARAAFPPARPVIVPAAAAESSKPTASAPAAVSAAPELKKVSLEEIRAAQEELAAESPQSNSAIADKLIEWAKKSDAGSTTVADSNAATAERGSLKLLEWLMNSATKVTGERDEKRVSEVLDQLTKLNSLVDRASNMEEALRLIEEAKLG